MNRNLRGWSAPGWNRDDTQLGSVMRQDPPESDVSVHMDLWCIVGPCVASRHLAY